LNFVGFQTQLQFKIAENFLLKITNVLLQLLRDILSGVFYQLCVNRFDHQRSRPNVNVCAVEENLEEELLLNQYSIISFQYKEAQSCIFVRNTSFLGFYCVNMGTFGVQI